jgi:hypothetical protein
MRIGFGFQVSGLDVEARHAVPLLVLKLEFE